MRGLEPPSLTLKHIVTTYRLYSDIRTKHNIPSNIAEALSDDEEKI
ncbi:unnamed protein product [Nezara viridula]|uniref:Uncharacterized protein n=1 Tax=Nezara viridula TaxID=85310 RepID=A0A9P0HE18_NEZVI|nr:unnamed protein product [Nezara viridula]